MTSSPETSSPQTLDPNSPLAKALIARVNFAQRPQA